MTRWQVWRWVARVAAHYMIRALGMSVAAVLSR